MDRTNPIRVLQVTIGDGNFGGVASFLHSYYSHMDHKKIHYDVLYCGKNSLKSKENDFIWCDSKIVELGIMKNRNNGFSEYKKLLPKLKNFLENNTYDIVHVNSGNPYVTICVAYLLKGKSIFISHSHNSIPRGIEEKKGRKCIKKMLSRVLQSYIIKKSDALFACSNEAGLYLFGKNGIELEKFCLIKNAIDTKEFGFNLNTRQKLKKNKKIIIGYIGRIAREKNPIFSLEIFSEFIKRENNAEFWMIGDGELRENVVKKIDELHLENNVILFGQRNDIPTLIQAMDLLLFPSSYEGFGIVAVEAQCSGLLVIASDQVPKSVDLTGLVTFLPLSETPSYWADVCIEKIENYKNRCDQSEKIIKAGFDIDLAAKNLEKKYLELISERI